MECNSTDVDRSSDCAQASTPLVYASEMPVRSHSSLQENTESVSTDTVPNASLVHDRGWQLGDEMKG